MADEVRGLARLRSYSEVAGSNGFWIKPAEALALLDAAERLEALTAELRVMATRSEPELDEGGMVRHPDGFGHSDALVCNLCPDYPHTRCVPKAWLRDLLAPALEPAKGTS